MSGRSVVFSILFFVLFAPAAICGDSMDLDWSAWQHMPTYDGRMMPVNTSARKTVDEICGRPSPYFDLEGVAEEDRKGPGYEDAEKLFPAGRRKFDAHELLFSWMVEPERWDYVPFLPASHVDLRKEVLGLEAVSPEGHQQKYVSPNQLQKAGKFWTRIQEISAKYSAGKESELTTVDAKVEKLYQAYRLYRHVTFNPDREVSERFQAKMQTALMTWGAARDAWTQVQQGAIQQAGLPTSGDLDDRVNGLQQSMHEFLGTLQPTASSAYAVREADPQLVALCQEAREIATDAAGYRGQVYEAALPTGMTDESFRLLKSSLHTAASSAAVFVQQLEEAQLSLYDSGHSLRVVPSLNPAALEKNRDVQDDAQPWINLQTLVLGSDDIVRQFVNPELPEHEQTVIDIRGKTLLDALRLQSEQGNPGRTVRSTFLAVAEAYVDRHGPNRSDDFAKAMDQFVAAVRSVGEGIEPYREKLSMRERDEALIAVTAYPEADATDAEVFYYALDPFLWTWIVSLLALFAFGLSFGVIRTPMFWVGIGILLFAQAIACWGLGLRVYITGWAPVTNMFETVIFVGLTVAVLGLWFSLQPLLGPGLKAAWRLSAVPGTPEATPLGDSQLSLMSAGAWRNATCLLLLPRIGLTYWVGTWLLGGIYAGAGLLPDAMTANDIVVWLTWMSIVMLLAWSIPRLAIMCLLGPVMIPYSWLKNGFAEPQKQAVARKPFAAAGAAVGLLAGMVAYYAPILDSNINPLMPILRDNFWLTAHVLSITAAYGAGALSWGLGNMSLCYYLFGRYNRTEQGVRAPESCSALGGYNYRAMQVAVILLAGGTILGGLWADVSWGRFWGWDPKEVWALVSLLIYIAILHGRTAKFFGDFGLAVGSVIGACGILMAWYGVNFVLGSGLHSYGSGVGGAGYMLLFILFNGAFCFAAGLRYSFTASSPRASTSVDAEGGS